MKHDHFAAMRQDVRIRFRLAGLIIVLAWGGSLGAQNPPPLAAGQRRAMTEKDLFDFIWIANPQLSPDGTRVAFTRVTVDEKRTNYETSIWIATTGGKA